MTDDAYRLLAQRLDALPNGFPATPDGAELRVLAKLFTPEQAAVAADLRLTMETAEEVAQRTGRDPAATFEALIGMARKGLIKAKRVPGGLRFGLLPWVVGIYEMQGPTMDAELARLVEDYYREALARAIAVEPSVHRVIPVRKTVQVDIEVQPYEGAAELVAANQAWGVTDCICRKQLALIGQACGHPLDVCLCLSIKPGAFDHAPDVRALTQEEALATLQRAAEAGLVHTVGNVQDGIQYICNCCTCGCGVLRAMSELGRANVVARSAFVCQVDEEACGACGVCIDACQFGAIASAAGGTAEVNDARCVGCGVCAVSCPEGALSLARRPLEEVLPPPANEAAWMAERAAARRLDLRQVM